MAKKKDADTTKDRPLSPAEHAAQNPGSIKPTSHAPSVRVSGLQTIADLKKANDGFADRAKKTPAKKPTSKRKK